MSVYPSHQPEARREANRLYRERKREELRAYDAARYAKRYADRKAKLAADPEAMARERERMYAWREAHPDEWRALNRRWRRKNPGYDRARKAGVPGSHTDAEWKAVVLAFGGACAYCGDKGKLTRDHVIPLSRQELAPSDDISNIVPACVSCNSRKRSLTGDEFRARLATEALCSPSA